MCVCVLKSGGALVCVMEGGAGAEPDPRVFYLHLNEAKGDLPSTAVSLTLSLSLCLSASQTDIDLFARQGDRQCCSALLESLLSLSFVPGKGLDPSHCCCEAAS